MDSTGSVAVVEPTLADPPSDDETRDSAEVQIAIVRALSAKPLQGSYKELLRALKFQPGNPRAWRFLAWECSYPISQQQRGAAESYAWVRRAVPVLIEGLDQTENDPQILFDLGSLFANRIGTPYPSLSNGDGPVLRKLFAADDELHAILGRRIDLKSALGRHGRPGQDPDPYLVGEIWFRRLEQEHDKNPARPLPMMPADVLGRSSRCLIKFARSLDEEAQWNAASAAWEQAAASWKEFAKRKFAVPGNRMVRLSDSPDDKWVKGMRTIARYDFWTRVITAEQSETVRDARRQIIEVERRLLASNDVAPADAKSVFDQSFRLWAAILLEWDEYEAFEWVGREMLEKVEVYRRHILKDGELPRDFPLRKSVEKWQVFLKDASASQD